MGAHLKAIDKRRRGFLWKGQENANGGSCLVSWDCVQRPLQFGGLGILNLELFGWALRIRWLWLQKTDASRPWAGLPLEVPPLAQALFDVAVVTVVGNGESTKFWTDRWLQGKSVSYWAPSLFQLIPNRAKRHRTMAQGLQNHSWISDISGALSVQVLVEYLQLWNLFDNLALQQEVPDQHVWRLTNHGDYTSKSAYEAFFTGTIKFGPWRRIWKSWAPLKCKFIVWLAIKNRCWTADRLAKRGLPHPSACPLCDQAEETIQHVLIGCVLAREVWTSTLNSLGLNALAPQPGCRRFVGWWCTATKAVPKEMKKSVNSLIILVAWEIWKHRDACVLEGKRTCVRTVLQIVATECALWSAAGASRLRELLTCRLISGD